MSFHIFILQTKLILSTNKRTSSITVCLKYHCIYMCNIRCFSHLWVSITKTYLYNLDPLKPHFYTVKLGFTGVHTIFLISAKNIDCGYSLEPPRRGGSNEYPQSMFWAEKWKNIRFFYLKTFSFLVARCSIYLNRRVFVMGIFIGKTDSRPILKWENAIYTLPTLIGIWTCLLFLVCDFFPWLFFRAPSTMIWTILVEVSRCQKLHTKYQRPGPCSFRQSLCKKQVIPKAEPFLIPGIQFQQSWLRSTRGSYVTHIKSLGLIF